MSIVPLHPSAHHIGRAFNFVLEQRNWLGFDYLIDAVIELKFKQPGTLAYVISEDKWYYWKNDIEGFVPEHTGGGSTTQDTILFSASRDANIVKDQYLRTEDGIPMNQAPLLLPKNYILYAITATTDANTTCSFEIRDNGVLIPGATLHFINEKQKYGLLNLPITAGSNLMIYNNGTTSKPRVNLWLIDVNATQDSVLFSSARNADVVKDQYLRAEDGIPMNQAPLLLPIGTSIYAMSVTTENNCTCSFEIHNNGILIPGAVINFVNEKQKYALFNITVVAGSKLSIFNKGQSNKPKVSVILKRS